MKAKVTNPIRLMLFSNATVRGGAEEHMLQLLHGVDRSYFQPHLACDPKLWEQVRQDCPADVPVTVLRLTSLSDIAGARQFFCLLRAQSIHIVHSHLFWSSLCASPIAWAARVPAVIETPHVRENWRKGLIKGHYVIDRSVGRCVDRYIAVSQANAEYLTNIKGIPRCKIRVIHPGCDFSRFTGLPGSNPSLRRELGFGAADPVLLVAGRLELQKGHAILLRALKEVRCRFPNVRLVCLSDGSLRPQLEALSREIGLESSVRFVGYQPDMMPWLSLADASVLPSFFEGLPLAAIESLAAGKPMIASAVDGTPDVIRNGETGLTVPAGDSARLAEAICTLIADPALRTRLGRTGRDFVLQNFSLAKLLRETQALYMDVLRRRMSLPEASYTHAPVSSEAATATAGTTTVGANHAR